MRLLAALLACLVAAPAAAADSLRGPAEADVLAVIDGDTLAVRAHIWIGQTVETRVRLTGIDTPELRGSCAVEKVLAERARTLLIDTIGEQPVQLWSVENDKFGGRVLAEVRTAAGLDARVPLLAAGLARPYDGSGPRADWCSQAALPD